MAESQREEIAKLEALYAGNPGGRVFVHLAEAYRKAGEHERARRILDEGLARHTDSASGYVVLGRVLADMQITAEAEVAFLRVLELDGGNLVALRWLGDLARHSGRNTEAATHYRELLIRNPSNEEVRELVETIEREANAPGVPVAGPAGDEPGSDVEDAVAGRDAFATMDHAARDEPALGGARNEGEEAALDGPARIDGTASPDVSAWSAAPGETTDAVDAGVETGSADIPGATADEDRTDAFTDIFESTEPEAGVVADVDDEGLDPDDLRRDDEAEPLEIHLLDAAYDGREDDEGGYVSDLDVSDLVGGGSLPEADDYADETFVADLSAAGTEEPAPDELPGGVDVMEAGDALTLLSDDAPVADDHTVASGQGSGLDAGGEDDESPAAEPDEGAAAAEEPQTAELARAAESGARWQMAEPEDAAGPEAPQMAELAGAAEPAAESRMGELPGADESAVESQIAEVRRGGETGLVTETMAVLYRSQGFHDRAADVYRALLRARPGDERLQDKLREAEEAAAGSRKRQQQGDDDSGEVWLRGVGAAWAAPDEADSDATPYAWTAEADDTDAGDPIGSYLQDLVSWKAGSGGWRPAADPQVEPETPDGAKELPDWMNGPGNESEPWTPDSEPQSIHAAPPAQDWTPSDGAVDLDPWDSAPPASEGEDAMPASAATGDDWQMPADPGVAQPADADETGGGWTPMDLDSDLPDDDAPSGTSPNAGPVSSKAESAGDDSSDDDDLEMFRSWLQSLKK